MVLVKLLITSATLKLVEVSLNVYEHEVDTVSIPHKYYRLSYGLLFYGHSATEVEHLLIFVCLVLSINRACWLMNS